MKKNNYAFLLMILLAPATVLLYIYYVLTKKKVKNSVVENVLNIETKEISENGLNERQMNILEYIKRNGGGRVSDMVDEFHATDRTLRRDLNKLENLGFVVRNGSTKSVSYKIKE